MSTTAAPHSGTTVSGSASVYLLVPILLLFALLTISVLRSPNLISSAGIGSAVIVTVPLVLATYALMALAIAGRGTVDLSIGPLIGFINVTVVTLNDAGAVQAPLEVFAYALAVGIGYQLLMGLIIVFVRVQPIIVSLSGYLALTGMNLVIMQRPGGNAPEWMMAWGAGTSILSPVLLILLLATGGWLLFAQTAFYGHLRLMGSDERAAYTAGVRITLVRLGAHCIAGVFAALAALSFTALIGSGDPTQGTTYTLVAVTALVLGGTSLAGGRGGVTGSLLGAVNLFLIGYVLATFSFGSIQGFVTDLAYGLILVLSLLLTVALPHLQRYLRHVSPFLVFVLMGLAFCGVMLHAKFDYTPKPLVPATALSAGKIEARAVARTASQFVLEPAVSAASADTRTAAPSSLLRNAAVGALLLVVLVGLARVLVTEAEARRFTPMLYVCLVVILLIGAWLLIDYTRAPTAASMPVPGAVR